jgi:hypothetical protein
VVLNNCSMWVADACDKRFPECLVVAGVGAAVMATADGLKLAAAVTRADEASIAETTPATGLAPFAAVIRRLLIVAGAQTTADKPSCVGDTRTEGNPATDAQGACWSAMRSVLFGEHSRYRSSSF